MTEYSTLEIIAIILIAVFVCKLLLSIFRGLWTCFLANLLGFGVKWRPGDDVWAIVTGGTDGIGLAYAKQLAAKGYSLFIISRNEDKLNAVAQSLKQQYSSCKQVKTLAVDFSQTDIYDKISEQLNQLKDIDVLVNNVGTIYEIPEYFTKIPKSFNESCLYINALSVTRMLEIVLPKMIAQKRGIILNISSSASDQPIPLFTTYAATKAYMTFLSEALSVEYESKGVLIQTVLPNQVKTKLSKNVYMPLLSVTPEQYVSHSMKTVGIEWSTYGHWKHKLIAYFMAMTASILGKRMFLKFGLISLNKRRVQFYRQNNFSLSNG